MDKQQEKELIEMATILEEVFGGGFMVKLLNGEINLLGNSIFDESEDMQLINDISENDKQLLDRIYKKYKLK